MFHGLGYDGNWLLEMSEQVAILRTAVHESRRMLVKFAYSTFQSMHHFIKDLALTAANHKIK